MESDFIDEALPAAWRMRASGIQLVIMRHVVGRGAFGTLMHLAFGQQADIADLEREVFLRGTHFGERFGVFGHGGEVVHFVGIALQVVKLFSVFRFFPEDGLLGREFAFIEEFPPDTRAGRFKLISDVLRLREMRHVIAQIDEAAVGDAAHGVDALVHAAAEAINEGLRLGLNFPAKAWPCIHSGGCTPMMLSSVGARSTKLTRRSDFTPAPYSLGARCFQFGGKYTTMGTWRPELQGQRLLRGMPLPWSA
jgi:hypothetical protein